MLIILYEYVNIWLIGQIITQHLDVGLWLTMQATLVAHNVLLLFIKNVTLLKILFNSNFIRGGFDVRPTAHRHCRYCQPCSYANMILLWFLDLYASLSRVHLLLLPLPIFSHLPIFLCQSETQVKYIILKK